MSASPISREIRRVLLLFVCGTLHPGTLSALDPNRTIDQYVVTRWGSTSAFPAGSINAIAQTPDGFLWLGAENALVRFDGVRFQVIEHATSPSMPPGEVLGLLVDADGVLWVRMQSPYLLRYRNGAFEQMYPAQLPSPFSAARERGATAMVRGIRGDILIAPYEGPLRYADRTFRPVVSAGGAGGLPISIAETADGAIWIGMRDTGLFQVRDGRGSQVGLPDQKVNALLAGAGPDMWIGTDSGLVRWNGKALTRQGVPASLTRSRILALARDRNSNLWVSTPTGVTRVASSGSTAQATMESLPGAVHAIFEDREGNLWFGGAKGLMQLRDAPFLSYPGVAPEGGSLYVDPAGTAWVAPSSGGLTRVRGGRSESITGLGLERDVIYSIAGGPGELWLARRLGGVTQLREEDGVLHARTFTARDGLAPGVVYTIHRARDASIWAGTLGGRVSRIQNGHITTFTMADGLGPDAVTTIQETANGVVWVGTAGGLAAFRNGSWRKYSSEDGLPPGRVNSLNLDPHGTLWIGSASGLFHWSGMRVEKAPNTPDALQREIYGLASDDAGNLWAATDRNVVTISRASLFGGEKTPAAAREFGLVDGLPSTRGIRRDRSVVKDPTGRIWFSLFGGVGVVSPSLPSALAPALVKVESLEVDGRTLEARSTVRYSSDRRRLIFHFIGMSLAVPGRVRYRYRLDDYDSDWSQPNDSREAVYTSLPPGRYTFRVMASNSEGLWNGEAASLQLEVEPQMAQTWWFRLMALCLITVAVFVGLRYRLARIHAAMNLRFEERLAERTRIARELHDTLLQSFQGLMLRLQVVQDLLPEGKAKEQLEQSLDRADQAIAEGRSALYDLRSSATSTNDLAEAVRALGDELATQNSAAFHLVVEGQPREFHPIVRDEIYRITREGLRNAFSHAQAKDVEAEITYGERAFRLRIRDDGQGISHEMLQAGRPGHYGLPGMRERARQIGANLEIWTAAKAGTEIALSIDGSTAYRRPRRRPLLWHFRRKQIEL